MALTKQGKTKGSNDLMSDDIEKVQKVLLDQRSTRETQTKGRKPALGVGRNHCSEAQRDHWRTWRIARDGVIAGDISQGSQEKVRAGALSWKWG